MFDDSTPGKYNIADSIWTSMGVQNRDEYISNYVILGKFHIYVHEDIVKSYETAEYLMACAYYHWPMYDEARKKLLGIFEMAVKLRSAELGNPLKTKLKNGKERKKNLVQLINEFQKYGYPEEFISKLHWLRTLRNLDAHPTHHSFAGATFYTLMYRIVNLINQLFLPLRVFNEESEKLNLLKENVTSFEDTLLFAQEGKGILVYDLSFEKCWKVDKEWKYVISCKPVIKKAKSFFEADKVLEPIVKTVKDLRLGQKGFSAVECDTNSLIKVIGDKRKSSIESYEKFCKDFNALDDIKQFANRANHNTEVNNHVENAVYQDWNNIFVTN